MSLTPKTRNNQSVHTEPRAARLFEINVVRRGPVTSNVIATTVRGHVLINHSPNCLIAVRWKTPAATTVATIPQHYS